MNDYEGKKLVLKEVRYIFSYIPPIHSSIVQHFINIFLFIDAIKY